ncbi:peptidoglycan editing factor PgeF [Noviherbaspirillum aridicola]|uniref:Purine nucleoside phosphorylase n=1 Tax=Noviherbaspirillum aridicola TaxID=2849687 RepID=A0ABQ4Q298_9BURK|nr:peptidoglycan editing factor PgeF [Noviherbaspirillum aridicola]GIZ51156.1 laccase domain protein [Noviherbaspirillum aridicola]
MNFIIPDWPAPASVRALSTTRAGGVSTGPYAAPAGGGLNLGVHVGDDPEAVARNRSLLRAHVPSEPAWLNQVHGVRVVDAGDVAGAAVDADAAIASAPGAVCVIQTADCLPVLFCDTEGKAVGAAHAGWRGLAGGVLQATAARMREAGAGEIMAWLGPAIGPQAFEVGQDVVDAFPGRSDAFRPIPGQPGKFLADIYLLARATLREAGVEKVAGGGRCTVSEPDSFYSYRRDRVTGRMASLVWLR